MIGRLVMQFIGYLLRFRYRIRVFEDPIMARLRKKSSGILFLPNHPALIDPLILYSLIYSPFKPKALVDEKQLNRPGMRWAAKIIDMLPIPDVSLEGVKAKDQIDTAYQRIVTLLRQGHNFTIYPSGRIYRQQFEDLGGNSFVHSVLRDVPDVQIVLVRTTGLWGSSYGFGRTGDYPEITKSFVLKSLWKWLTSGLFFVPKRDVKVAFYYPATLPRSGTRPEINQYLESFYNQDAPSNLYVPHSLWEFGKPRFIPEPTRKYIQYQRKNISEDVRRKVFEYLSQETGQLDIQGNHHLARDLMMDSLMRAEIVLWVEKEFGVKQESPDAFETVQDVLMAGSGEVLRREETLIERPCEEWFENERKDAPRIFIPEGDCFLQVLWKRVRATPNRMIVADEKSGAKSYRQLLLRSIILRELFLRYKDDERLGIMLPASVAATVSYIATLLANKIPVMVNWTVGMRNLRHSLKSTKVKKILTSKLLVHKLEGQGINFAEVKDQFIYLEDLAPTISIFVKIKAALLARFGIALVEKWPTPATSVVLFTSGSEGLPKSVPIMQAGQVWNLRGVLEYIEVTEAERIMGFLPPFHSFGIMMNITLPLLAGIPVVYHANPTDTYHIAKLVESYRATILAGTPTFLYAILRASRKEQLESLHLAVLGAEKCPDYMFTLLAEKCPQLKILEGYGITECSPVLSITPTALQKLGAIGKILSNIEYTFVNPKNEKEFAFNLEGDREGLLLVRGPSIFDGYLVDVEDGGSASSPFVPFRGRMWYRTGDVVAEDEDGYIHFKARLKRFAKIGGEMISLPAIEEVLLKHLASPDDEGPILAVESLGDEKPDLVLVTTKELTRESVNKIILDEGLGPLNQIKRIVKIDSIPVLGSGKTDYQTLKSHLA